MELRRIITAIVGWLTPPTSKWAKYATTYTVYHTPTYPKYDIHVERRTTSPEAWAIVEGTKLVYHKGWSKFWVDSNPIDDQENYKLQRYSSLDEAMAVALNLAATRKTQYDRWAKSGRHGKFTPEP